VFFFLFFFFSAATLRYRGISVAFFFSFFLSIYIYSLIMMPIPMFAGRLFFCLFRTQQHENRKLIYIEHCLSLFHSFSFVLFLFFLICVVVFKTVTYSTSRSLFYDDVSHTYTCAFEIVNQETSKVW